MGLTDPGLQILVVVLCIIAPLVTLVVWSRVRGPVVLRWLQRLLLVLMAQLLAVLAAFVILQRDGGLRKGHEVEVIARVQNLLPLIGPAGLGLLSLRSRTARHSTFNPDLLVEEIPGGRTACRKRAFRDSRPLIPEMR